MMTDEMIKTVTDRANEMLKEPEINKMYQDFPNKKMARTWLIKTAAAYLIELF